MRILSWHIGDTEAIRVDATLPSVGVHWFAGRSMLCGRPCHLCESMRPRKIVPCVVTRCTSRGGGSWYTELPADPVITSGKVVQVRRTRDGLRIDAATPAFKLAAADPSGELLEKFGRLYKLPPHWQGESVEQWLDRVQRGIARLAQLQAKDEVPHDA